MLALHIFQREVAEDLVEQFLGEVHLETTKSDCGHGGFLESGDHRY